MNHTNEGSKLYLYSITSVAILGGLLFGYDTAVISGAEKGLEAFFLTATDFQYDKVMHGITSSSALIGCVLGGALSGIFASRLGRRNSLRLAAVLFFLSALGSYYPEFLFFEYGKANMNLLITFNLYRILGGIGVGLASAVCPMYIAEIAPSNIRGTLVSCNQFAIIFGMLVVYFVNYLILGDHQNPVILKDAAGTLSVSSESDMWTVTEGWRYMFGSEAFPAAFFGMLLFFVPKTPRYLVIPASHRHQRRALLCAANIRKCRCRRRRNDANRHHGHCQYRLYTDSYFHRRPFRTETVAYHRFRRYGCRSLCSRLV